jgi:alanine racemase
MRNLTRRILRIIHRQRFPYTPLITVEISRERLLHNLNQFAAMGGGDNGNGIGSVAPVLKSNAYGHGLFEIAGILENENRQSGSRSGGTHIPFFVVDSYFEAIALRTHGIRTPLLVVGYTRPETIVASRLSKTAFTITSIETLKSVAQFDRPVSIHIKIDTGMHRQGLLPNEIDTAIDIVKDGHMLLEGVCSHFSDADNTDPAFTEKQIDVWNMVVAKFKMVFPTNPIKYFHTSATDGHRHAAKIDANISRLGIGLYGLSDDPTFAQKMDLKPALEMKTIITGVKKIEAGETVGYGKTFVAPRDMTIATIPVGYFEGLNRKLSSGAGNGSVHVGENRLLCPIIGRISMNITIIDVSGMFEKRARAAHSVAHIGMPVVAISNNADNPNSIATIAKKSGTITYEIAVHIPAHLKRVVL